MVETFGGEATRNPARGDGFRHVELPTGTAAGEAPESFSSESQTGNRRTSAEAAGTRGGPGWKTIQQVPTANIETPDNSPLILAKLGIMLPMSWESRPLIDDSQMIARGLLTPVAGLPRGA